MRFKCPKCRTVYDIPEGKAKSAPKMRCHVCGNVWKITFPEPEQEAAPEVSESVDPFAQEAEGEFSRFAPKPHTDATDNMPELNSFLETPFFDDSERRRRSKRSAWTFFLLGIMLMVVSAFLLISTPSRSLPVSFENVSYYFTEQEYKRFLNIEGALVNKANVPAEIRTFYVRFFNKGGINIANQQIPAVLPPLKPQEAVPFSLKIERPPATAETIELILKNVKKASAEITDQKNERAAQSAEAQQAAVTPTADATPVN